MSALTPDQALLVFLHGSLGAKRARVVDFASRAKTRSKFLDLLYHQVGGLVRASSVVAQLPSAAWGQAALRFKPPAEFGIPVATLRDAYAENGQNELVITADGHYGYWRDETYVDSEILLLADLSRSAAPAG
jgi:hypothetical protein